MVKVTSYILQLLNTESLLFDSSETSQPNPVLKTDNLMWLYIIIIHEGQNTMMTSSTDGCVCVCVLEIWFVVPETGNQS